MSCDNVDEIICSNATYTNNPRAVNEEVVVQALIDIKKTYVMLSKEGSRGSSAPDTAMKLMRCSS